MALGKEFKINFPCSFNFRLEDALSRSGEPSTSSLFFGISRFWSYDNGMFVMGSSEWQHNFFSWILYRKKCLKLRTIQDISSTIVLEISYFWTNDTYYVMWFKIAKANFKKKAFYFIVIHYLYMMGGSYSIRTYRKYNLLF